MKQKTFTAHKIKAEWVEADEAEQFTAGHEHVGYDENGIPVFRKKQDGGLWGIFYSQPADRKVVLEK